MHAVVCAAAGGNATGSGKLLLPQALLRQRRRLWLRLQRIHPALQQQQQVAQLNG